MSQTPPIKAIYVDGETKTGKGAASKAIADALTDAGYEVYYDVAGDFFRRYVAIVREFLDLDEGEALPTGEELLQVAKAVHETRRAYKPDSTLGNLQRSSISRSVSVLGALPFVQAAGVEWYRLAAESAHDSGADVLVLDGRNPRARIAESGFDKLFVQTVLDLYMTCDPAEAARRTLHGRGIDDPTDEIVERESHHVIDRRERDRQRADRPFIPPEPSLRYVSETTTPHEAIAATWNESADNPPTALLFDNTVIRMPDMLELVSAIALAAVSYKP